MSKTTIISLGGSLIYPNEKGIDMSFLKRFKKFVLEQVNQGRRLIIVTGGGRVCRDYQRAASKISKIKDKDLDWIGIRSTKLNAELLRSIFGNLAYKEIIDDPTLKINTNKKIIIGSGWVPGSSSDKDAVLLAENFVSDTVINLSNIDFVYDKDPSKYKNAQKIKNISWKDFITMVGGKWFPGNHSPFDPVASRLAKKAGLRVVIMNGRKISNLKKFLQGKNFQGTVIQ